MTLFGNKQSFTEEESSNLCWELMEMNFIPMAAFDNELFVVCNQAFLDLIGYDAKDIEEGINWKEMTPEEELSKDVACIDELQTKTIPSPYQKEYIKKDGSRVKFVHHNCVVAPGRVKGITVLVPI